jgi:hypothetical protein
VLVDLVVSAGPADCVCARVVRRVPEEILFAALGFGRDAREDAIKWARAWAYEHQLLVARVDQVAA